ncbi:MAG: DUF2079 domain-containing protein [Polyangiaceae bacterium]|nr:DUF2079 domain-containing protein [Polyangiaceae bacterium]
MTCQRAEPTLVEPSLPALTVAFRALAIAGVGGVSLGFFCAFLLIDEPVPAFLEGGLSPMSQKTMLAAMVGLPAFLALAAALYLGLAAWRGGRRSLSRSSHRLYAAVRVVSPLFLVSVIPFLFRWSIWGSRPLLFLGLVSAFSLAAYGTTRLAAAALPAPCGDTAPARLWRRLCRPWWGRPRWPCRPRWRGRWRPPSAPTLLVAAGILGYVAYFSYYTVAFHVCVRTGYDTSIYDNLVWNLVHGGPFFKSSSRFGPEGGHFGVHAELFAYVLAPVYAIYPRAHSLLVAQSVLIGAAAWPLYCFARRHVGSWFGAAFALVYLLHPAVHNANLYEFHFLPLGMVFLWAALNFLETRRDVLAALAIVLTLSVREDVATWVVILGVALALTGTRPRAGLIVAAAGAVYFLVMRFLVMPRFAGAESFVFIYRKLLPPGEVGLSGILKTVLTNPLLTLIQVWEEQKLVYSLQLLLPLFFLPVRRPIFLVLAAPTLVFSFLSTEYLPVAHIRFQYGAHALVFFLVGAVWALERTVDQPWARARTAAVVGMLSATLPISYQFGAVLQRQAVYAGPVHYRFGIDAEGAWRRDAMAKLLALVPPRAKIAASGFTTPQVTNRPDAYNLTIGLFDAEYLLVPSERQDFIVDEHPTTVRLLTSGTFGIVAVEPPFALARRGHGTGQNPAFLDRIGR